MLFAIGAAAFRFDGRKNDVVEILRTFTVTPQGHGHAGKVATPDIDETLLIRFK
jgi:hypothetical protein